MTAMAAIGINFGSYASSVAVYKDNDYKVIDNEGSCLTPSYVAFDEDQLIGEEAKVRLKTDGRNVVFNVKQIVGRQFSDRRLQQKLIEWPFDVIDGDGGDRPKIQVDFRNETVTLTPEDIVSILISKMKSVAAGECGGQITDAVISVPSFFNSHQRQSIINAARSVKGLMNIRLINNTTAIALSYFNLLMKRRSFTGQNILIFDLGATSFEVSIVTVAPGRIDVKSSVGTCNFGGNDFDERLLRHLLSKFERKFNSDLKCNKNLIQKLRSYCEEAKVQLSQRHEARVRIDNFVSDVDFDHSITRYEFERICGDLFHFIHTNIERALFDSNMNETDIAEIIVVGGASKMPKIQWILNEVFVKKKLNKSLNATIDCIAIGAAIQASIINGTNDKFRKLKIKSLIPYTYGIETSGGIMTPVINRNAQIPCRHKKCFTTNYDNQTQLKVKIFDGETVVTKYNHLIGTFTFDGISLAAKGEPKIDLYFDIDANGILTVYGSERLRTTEKGFKGSEGESMATASGMLEFEEERRKCREEAKNKLERLIFQTNCLLTNDNFCESKKDAVRNWSVVVNQWLKMNPFASKDELDHKRLQIEELINC